MRLPFLTAILLTGGQRQCCKRSYAVKRVEMQVVFIVFYLEKEQFLPNDTRNLHI